MTISTRRKIRRIATFTAAALVAVAMAHVAAEWYSREAPNYSRIEDGLWLGGYVDQPPTGCSAVLNLCEAEDSYRTEAHDWSPIRDAEPAPSLDWLGERVRFIETQRAASRGVYVHCMAGVSRSGMVMTAYLMRREGWSRDRAIEFLRAKRPSTRPNPAFMELLLEWEKAG